MKFLTLLLISNVCNALTTGTLNLSGTIPAIVSITVSQISGTNLDLTTTTSNLAVGEITENSNVSLGYSMFISSLNSGNLTHVSGDLVAYTAKYDNVSFALANTNTLVKSGSGGVMTDLSTLSISYMGQDATTLKSGNYIDTLTVTIQGL